MNILVSNSYFYPLDNKQWVKKQPYPPLATIQAVSVLEKEGHQVSFFDTNLIDDPSLIQSELDKKPDLFVIYDDGFNYLTKMCLTVMRDAAFQMILLAKEKGVPVAISSSDSTDQSGEYLQKGADFILLGEAEETLIELSAAIQNQTSTTEIKGLVLLENKKEKNTGRRPVLQDLDKLPLPSWNLVDLNSYRKIWMEGNGYFSLNLATTRGCPYKCNWCAKPIYGQRYNSRSPEHVVREIELLNELLGENKPTNYWMCDDIFGLKPGWVQEFNSLCKSKNLKFKYTIQSRVDLLLKEDTITALAESGAEEIWVGAESGSQKILDAMDKGTSVAQIKEASKLLKQKGVRVALFLQFGYPGETKADIQKTIDMVLDIMPDNIGVSVSYPLPGTPFYESVKSELSQKANWRDSDDLDLMFKNTYSSEYYRKLQRYIHRMLRKKQGIINAKQIINPKNWSAPNFRSVALYPFYKVTTSLDKQELQKLENQTK